MLLPKHLLLAAVGNKVWPWRTLGLILNIHLLCSSITIQHVTGICLTSCRQLKSVLFELLRKVASNFYCFSLWGSCFTAKELGICYAKSASQASRLKGKQDQCSKLSIVSADTEPGQEQRTAMQTCPYACITCPTPSRHTKKRVWFLKKTETYI